MQRFNVAIIPLIYKTKGENHMPLINKKEYDRLFDLQMNDCTPWTIRSQVCVESFIDEIFEENKFFHRIVFDDNYNILKSENHNQGTNVLDKCIGDLKISDFDHYSTISFKRDISHLDTPETISGIVNFPYINGNWEWIGDFISKVPDGWSVFVINPILMRYVVGSTVGLFLTPTYGMNHNIDNFNEFIVSRTGYPLFLTYVDWEDVIEILCKKPDLSKENYIAEIKRFSNRNRGLCKLLDFWYENDCVNVDLFDEGFMQFQDNQSFSAWQDINFQEITSNTPFCLIHEKTGEVLGPFRRFEMDESCRSAYTDCGVLELSVTQIDDLVGGKYDFKIIR